MFRSVPFVVFTSFFCAVSIATAAMTSTNYRVEWDSINVGGNELGTSANFGLYDTIGEVGAGNSTSTNYQLRAGYRAEDGSQRLVLEVGLQDSTSTPASAYTGLNAIAKTVTVTNPGAFSVGDTIIVIEDQGFNQQLTFGEIGLIVGNDLYVDRFAGDQATMQSSPTGGNDYVYKMNFTNFVFGVISSSTETTLASVVLVHSDAAAGYSLYLQGTSDLQDSAGNVIDPVLDGAVTLGSEEYGISITGDHVVNGSTDIGVTTTPRLMMSSTSPTGDSGDRSLSTAKIAITDATIPGNYSQTLYYVLVPRF